MAKKNQTAATKNTNPETPVSETPVATPTTFKQMVNVPGVGLVEVDVPLDAAMEIAAKVKEAPEAKAKRDAGRKAKIAAAQKAKRDAEKAAHANDPEWLAKEADRKAKRDARLAVIEKRKVNSEKRAERATKEQEANAALLAESGSSLPLARLVEASITKLYEKGMKGEDGAHRGWLVKFSYNNVKGISVKYSQRLSLDERGVGTLDSLHADAKKILLDMIADAK